MGRNQHGDGEVEVTFSLNITGSAPKEQEEKIKKELAELLGKYGREFIHYAGWRGTFTGGQELLTQEKFV